MIQTKSKRIESLISEFSKNRSELDDMLKDVKESRSAIDQLLPKKVDYKSKWVIQERVKAITEILKAELSIRKHKDDSLRVEIELLRKVSDEEQQEIDSNMIRKIVEVVEKNELLKKKTNKVTDIKYKKKTGGGISA